MESFNESLLNILLPIIKGRTTKKNENWNEIEIENELHKGIASFQQNEQVTSMLNYIELNFELDATKSKENHVLLKVEPHQEPLVVDSKTCLLESWKFEKSTSSKNELSCNAFVKIMVCLLNYLPCRELCDRLARKLPLSNNHFMSINYYVTKKSTSEMNDSFYNFVSFPLDYNGYSISCKYLKTACFKIKSLENALTPIIPIAMDENYFCKDASLSYFNWARLNNLTAASPLPSLFRNPSSLNNRDSKAVTASCVEEKDIEVFCDHCQNLLHCVDSFVETGLNDLNEKDFFDMKCNLVQYIEIYKLS